MAPAATARIMALGDEVCLSIVTRVELEGGVARDPSQGDERRRLDRMPVCLSSISTARALTPTARIVQAAGYSRRKLLDRMIAAQAVTHRATLVTRNAVDFRDIPELALLDWSD